MSVQKEMQTFENPVSEGMEQDDDTGQDETAIVKQHQEIGLSDRAKMTAVLQSKIFGFEGVQGEEGEAESGEALKQACCGLLHPDTRVRAGYDALQLLVMLWLAWSLPRNAAFGKESTTGPMYYLGVLVDLSVLIDIFVNMSAYQNDPKTGRLVTDRKKLRAQYLHSWFLIDFFSVVPVDHILLIIGTTIQNNAGSSDTAAELGFHMKVWANQARLLRLLRLVRLGRLKQLLRLDMLVNFVHHLLKRFGVTRLAIEFQFRVLILLGIMVGGSHFLGCMWLYFGRQYVLTEDPPQGWMAVKYEQDSDNHTRDFIACFGKNFNQESWNSKHGSSCEEGCAYVPKENPYDVDCSWIGEGWGLGDAVGVGLHEDHQYIDAFYFSLVTISTVGYGDISPSTPKEKQFVIVAITCGAFMYAYIIGDFSNLITNLSRENADFDAKMRQVQDMLAYIEASDDVCTRVQEFYDYKFANKEGPPEIFDELPPLVQTRLVKERWNSLINKVPFFADCTDKATVEICMKIHSFTVGPGDNLMTKGEEHDELLILSKGKAKSETSSSKGDELEETFYEAGAFWGELQFTGLVPARSFDVTAVLFCEVASLDPSDMHEVLAENPVFANKLFTFAEIRLAIETKLESGEEFDMDELTREMVIQSQQKLRDFDEGEGNSKSASTPLEKALNAHERRVDSRIDKLEQKLDTAIASIDKMSKLMSKLA